MLVEGWAVHVLGPGRRRVVCLISRGMGLATMGGSETTLEVLPGINNTGFLPTYRPSDV